MKDPVRFAVSVVAEVDGGRAGSAVQLVTGASISSPSTSGANRRLVPTTSARYLLAAQRPARAHAHQNARYAVEPVTVRDRLSVG